jgi:uncharacterized protein (TIGR02246 family)
VKPVEPVQLVDRLTAAFNTKDAEAFAALFAEDAEFVNILGRRMRRRDGIAAGHEIVFARLLAGSRLSVTRIDILPLGDDMAMMHATWTRERLPDATPTTLPPGTGIFTFVACRTDDWLLVGATNVQDASPPVSMS